ncbi:hypothetical protein [Sphingomonas sp.]|jgi:hypothetical protein|uniref:hypothetical protein n=1 Tax=Sphingomonas sp. TaxID=28214 RepID=UPI002DEBEDF7|nr:hypothetical protein [Sphingomonas sp.]
MVQVFITIFFSLAAIGAVLMIVSMLRRDWDRVVAILNGSELAQAQASLPRVRVRQRAWGRPEQRTVPQRRAAAA